LLSFFCVSFEKELKEWQGLDQESKSLGPSDIYMTLLFRKFLDWLKKKRKEVRGKLGEVNQAR
jgi:hypothetical protein